MKHIMMLVTVLISIITLSPTLSAGDNYFWAGDQRVSIDYDYYTLVVAFKQEKYNKNTVSIYENIAQLAEAIVSGDQRMVVLIFERAQSKPESEILNSIGITMDDIEWYSFGYIANGITPLRPTNRISFKLKEGITTAALEKIIKGRAILDQTYFGTPQIKVNGPSVDIISLSNEIYESGIAEYCCPDFIANITHFDDPLYPDQYFLNNIGQFSGAFDIDIEAPEAWELSTGTSTIKVAVIDNGVEAHNDLKDGSGNSRIIGGFTPQGGGNGSPSNTTDYHGEACAGIIAASHNNINVRGIAPNVKLLTINIFAPNTSNDQVADGINWAWQNGADVLSNSWGYVGQGASGFTWPAITNAINNARTNGRGGKGCVVVFAAGNNYPTDPLGYGPPGYISYPANVTGVLCVSATNRNGDISSYSSRGSRIDVTALGGETGANADIRTLDRMGANGKNSGDDMTNFNGTSAACPQVSGVAALILAVNPNLTEQQVRDIITSNTTDMGSAGKDNLFGWGRINAARSVAKAYALANTNYTFSVGTAPLHQYDTNFDMVFEASPCPGVAAGRYIVDRHYIDITLGGFTSTPYGWYTAPYGYSWANPNNCSRYLNKTTTSSSVRFRTVFYWIKYVYPNGSTINKWAPFNPSSSVLREYVTLGMIPQLSVTISGPPSAQQYTTSYFDSDVTGAQGNVTYQWEQMYQCCGDEYNCGTYFFRGSNSDLSIYNNSQFHYYLRLTVWDGLGRSAVDYHYVTVETCAPGGGGSGCPTLAFESDSLSDSGTEDENVLLISSPAYPTEDVVDYYLIQSEIAPIRGEIHFTIHEPQTEHTWLDQVEMMEVEVDQDELVAVTDNGEVVNYIEPVDLITIMLNDSIDVSEALSAADENSLNVIPGDVLSIEITGGEGDINSNNLFIILEGFVVAKNITADIMFIPEGEGDDDLGDVYLRPNVSVASLNLGSLGEGTLLVEFHQEGTIDYLTLVNDLNTADIETLEMLSAVHNEEGSVLELLIGNPDQHYAEIFPGQEITFAFREGTHSLPKVEYILKTVGRYETDTTDSYQKLAKTTEEVIIPKENKLYDNYPNPFNPTTQIKFAVKESGLVTLKIYDVLGKEVYTLVNEEKDSGIYTINFDGSNLSSGIYFCTISTKDFLQTKKMMLLK